MGNLKRTQKIIHELEKMAHGAEEGKMKSNLKSYLSKKTADQMSFSSSEDRINTVGKV